MNIAITIIAYNRVDSLQRVLSSVERAYYDQPVSLIISIDKSKTTAVEEYADKYNWPHGEKRVIKHVENLGLRRHVLECGDRVCEYDAMVVLEDDITVAESFFIYAKKCVEKYYNEDEIAGISLYSWSINLHNFMPFTPISTESDIYLMKIAQSWGQVWMKRQWQAFKEWYNSKESVFTETAHLPKSICGWSEKSWLKFHTKYCIEKNKYFVYPYTSLSTNYSEPGTHNKKVNSVFQVPLLHGIKKDYVLNPKVRYDGFYEYESIYESLGLSSMDICVDLYGNKGNREGRKYWLTTYKTPNKLIRTYGLVLKPIEQNVIDDIPGNDIFLYECQDQNTQSARGSWNVLGFLYNIEDGISFLKRILKYLVNYKQY